MEFDEWLKENAAFINACSFEKERLRIAYVGGKRSALDNQWISVKDRLPNKPQWVNVIHSDNRCPDIEYYDPDEGYCLHESAVLWMPIPELPK